MFEDNEEVVVVIIDVKFDVVVDVVVVVVVVSLRTGRMKSTG